MNKYFRVFRLKYLYRYCLFLLTSMSLLFFANTLYATYPPTFSDCLMGDGDEYDQVDACQQLLRSNSKNRDLHVALTKTLDKRQKFKQALEAYVQALKTFPNDDYFFKKSLIAKSNYKEQQWLKNKKLGRKAESNSSSKYQSSQFKLNKIRCTRLAGKTALNACQNAIKINDKDADIFVSMGDIYASQQKNTGAISAYKRALKLNSSDKKTSEKLNKLLQRKVAIKKKKSKPKVVYQAKKKPVKKKKITAPVKNKTNVDKSITKTSAGKTNTTASKIAKPVAAETKTTTLKLKPEQQQFLEQLNLLRSLKEQKIISQEEYEQRKKLLLDSTFRVSSLSNAAKSNNKKEAIVKKSIQGFGDLNFGNYHALIIGNNDYKDLPELKTAVNDASSLAELLKEHYGFKVKLLLNANRYDTLKAMGEFRNTLTKDDNLLIYYAGHGVLDNASERGYWLPVDAERDFTSNWISTAEVTDTLKALQSWHVLVVADSCYSGTLARSISVKFTNPEKKYSLIERLLKKKSRTVITSGGLEPVTDSGGDNHSVFSEALLDVLKNTKDVIEAEEVFSRLRDNVILNADQTPEYSNVRKVGHNGGDFIFFRQ